MEGKRELRRSPRFNRSPKRRRSSLLPPTKSILKKSEDTTNFDILQDENTTTNVLGSLWESNTTMFTRNFDESEITENGDGQRRRKSLGRRVSFASKARVRLFDKDEATEKQAPEPKKSNPFNGNHDEASDFMLTISAPSPNDSMIENVDSPSSRFRSENDDKSKYAEQHLLPQINFNMVSNDNQNILQNMPQAQNSNMQMICQYNTAFGSMNDQQSFKDRDDTFATGDMSLVSMIGPEYHDVTSTSVCPRDMTLVSIVNQSPPDKREITHTSMDVQDMTLASVVGLSPSENCHASTDVRVTSMVNQFPSENCNITRTSMGVQDMTLASMVGLSPSENYTSMSFRDMTLASMVNQSPPKSIGDKDMTLASMVNQSPPKSIGDKDMTLASIVNQSPPKSMVNQSPPKSIGDKDMTLASIINQSPPKSIGDKDMTLASMVNQSPPKSISDKDMTSPSLINQAPSRSKDDKDMTPILMVSRSPSKPIDVKNMAPELMVSQSPSSVKDMTLASMVGLSPSENHNVIRTIMGVSDMTIASSVESSDDMSLVYEENIQQNEKQTNSRGSMTNLRSDEGHETTFIDVADGSLIHEVNVTLCDETAAMISDENIPKNMDIVTKESIGIGDLNKKDYQKLDSADTEMNLMKAMIEEQNQQIELFEAELESINKETQSLKEMRDNLIKEKAEMEQKIRDAKQLVEVTQCYTEEDLNEVQEKYRNLIAKYKWFPKNLSEELVHLVYDETVQVKIDIGGLHKRDDTIIEVSLDLSGNMKPDEKLYYQAIFDGIQKFALDYKGTIEIATCSGIIKPIAAYWENSKQLYRDYRVLRFKLPTEIINSQIINNNEKSIIMRFRVKFFNYKAKTNFYIKFLFRWEDVISYPNISNLLWEIEIIYGKVNEPFIKETLNKHLSSNVLGCIRDACVVIQKNGFVF